MGNKVGRILIGILIIGVAGFAIYKFLPGSVKYPLQQFIQSKTDDHYAEIVDAVKASSVPKHKKINYGDMVAAMNEDASWTIEKSSVDKTTGDGSYIVYADAYKYTVSVENENNDDGMVTHTDAHVRLVFKIEKNGNELKSEGSRKVMEAGEVAYPTSIEIDNYVYHKSDSSSYYQASLDCMCSSVGAE